jgi:hypothetical protein
MTLETTQDLAFKALTLRLLVALVTKQSDTATLVDDALHLARQLDGLVAADRKTATDILSTTLP